MMTSPTPNRTEDEKREAERTHVLMKRGLYWRPEGCGYTGVLAEAGRYTAWEAAYTRDHDPEVKTMLASEAPEFSSACWEEMKLRARTKERDAAEAEASALRERVARLKEALRPFAAITPSTLHHDDGSEREPYSVVLGHPADEADFTGADLARARAALNDGGSNAV